MKNGTKLSILALVIVAAAALAFFCFRGEDVGGRAEDRKGERGGLTKLRRGGSGKARPVSAKQAVRDAMDSLPKDRKRSRVRREKVKFDLLDGITGRERKDVENLLRLLDENDTEGALKLASKAAESENPEVRMQALEAMSWVGSEALPEMTALMADKDEDVAEMARYHWEMALDFEDDPQSRLLIASAAFSAISDEDSLASVGAVMSNAAMEIVDGEEDERKAAVLRQDVVQVFVDAIEGDQNAARVAAAKEAYEDFTGEAWEGVDAAEAYLRSEFDYEAAEAESSGAEATEAEAGDEETSDGSDGQDQDSDEA